MNIKHANLSYLLLHHPWWYETEERGGEIEKSFSYFRNIVIVLNTLNRLLQHQP